MYELLKLINLYDFYIIFRYKKTPSTLITYFHNFLLSQKKIYHSILTILIIHYITYQN